MYFVLPFFLKGKIMSFCNADYAFQLKHIHLSQAYVLMVSPIIAAYFCLHFPSVIICLFSYYLK